MLQVDGYVYMFMFEREGISDISMVVICHASGITRYDKRTPELSDAPLHITQIPTV